jgi:hypothetical protein
MGPVNLVAYYRQMFGFLHYFIGWLGRETGYGPTDQSVDVLWILSGALFSGAVTMSNSVNDSWEIATYGDHP